MGLTSQYMGMYSQQMGYAQQLSAMGPYSPYAGTPGVYANNAAMGMMRGAGHIGNAAVTLGGIGAGMAATSAFGAAAGTGIGIPIAAAGMAATYAGGQMMHGAEQQNMLNMGLRANFGFRNNQGGTGFTTGQMGQIGGQLREMSHQFGPGGEITSFNELSSLAAKMGQMNMSQGVRDVQTFTKKFKEMTDALKTMARDLGTTMEGAMEFANQAKQSGVFGMKNQANFTSMARGMAVSGGLAMSEVTSAANIGSQISRSIGGLGRQGALGGMRTIGQIGTAQQMGILSEEDIYNATGLTGAEGRQAFAMSNMSRTASFLKSGRGRRMLSAIADKDGNLDEGALDQFMSGGMGVGETMSSWAGRKDRIGRANFIRNEGRLRGAALEKIGGFGDAMQMMQWAQSKGIDINDMDDRSMLFAQRQLGMGRDEADQAIKMAQNMPAILAKQKEDASFDSVTQRIAQRRKTQGIEGIKNRFDQARESINGHLEKMGQDIFNEGSEQIEAFLNKLAGVYVETHTADMQKLDREIRRGGASEAAARRRSLGQGAGGLRGSSLFGAGSAGGGFGSFSSGSSGGFGGGDTMRFLFQGESGLSRMKSQGYDLSHIGSLPAGERDAALRKELNRVDEITQGAGMANREAMRSALGQGGSWIDAAYAKDQITGNGDEQILSFEKKLQEEAGANNPSAKALLAQWKNAKGDPRTQASIIESAKAARGITAGGSLKADTNFGAQAGRFHTQDERLRFIGENLAQGKGPSTGQKLLVGGVLSAMIPGGALLADKVTNLFSGDSARQKKQAGLIASEGFQNLVSDALGKGDTTGLMKAINTEHDKDYRKQYQELQSMAEYQALKNSGADPQALSKKAQEMGLSVAEAEDKIGKMKGLAGDINNQNEKDRKEYLKRVHGDVVGRMKSRGLMTDSGELRKLTKDEAGKLGSVGSKYLEQLVGDEQIMSAGMDISGRGDARVAAFGKMSVSELKAFSALAGGTHEGAEAASTAAIQKKLIRSGQRGRGGAGSIADALGISLSKEDAKELKGLGAADLASNLAGRLGVGDSDDAKNSISAAARLLSDPKASDAARREAAAKLQTAKGIAEDKKTEEQKNAKEKEEKDSPMYKVLDEIKQSLHGAFGAKGTDGQVLTKLGAVVDNTKKEDKGDGST